MNTDWKTFLEKNGATFEIITNVVTESETERLVAFNNKPTSQALSTKNRLLCTPSQRSLLKVSGADAESFLQNQLTNDIRNVDDTNHQASAWCSPKGRIIANFRIFKQDDTYFLSLASDLVEHVVKKLRMYVMMSKVAIEDVTDEVIHFSYFSNDADSQLQKLLGIDAQTAVERINHQTLTLLRYNDNITRYDVFGSVEEIKKLWSQLQEIAEVVNDDGLSYSNILAGRPEISAASTEAWIPQMVNYIHVNGVDFKKGCYPGQEVVARLNYLGKTKRRLYRLAIDSDEQPEVGTNISSEKDTAAGKVLIAVKNAEGGVDALAVMKISEANQVLHIVSKNGSENAPVTVLDLPYVVNDE